MKKSIVIFVSVFLLGTPCIVTAMKKQYHTYFTENKKYIVSQHTERRGNQEFITYIAKDTLLNSYGKPFCEIRKNKISQKSISRKVKTDNLSIVINLKKNICYFEKKEEFQRNYEKNLLLRIEERKRRRGRRNLSIKIPSKAKIAKIET